MRRVMLGVISTMGALSDPLSKTTTGRTMEKKRQTRKNQYDTWIIPTCNCHWNSSKEVMRIFILSQFPFFFLISVSSVIDTRLCLVNATQLHNRKHMFYGSIPCLGNGGRQSAAALLFTNDIDFKEGTNANRRLHSKEGNYPNQVLHSAGYTIVVGYRFFFFTGTKREWSNMWHHT